MGHLSIGVVTPNGADLKPVPASYFKVEAPGTCPHPKPLGMQDHGVMNNKITASSFSPYGAGVLEYGPSLGRLEQDMYSWTAGEVNLDQWIQVEFVARAVVTSVATQGHPLSPEWVRKYIVSTMESDNSIWVQQRTNGALLFPGNTDQHTVIKNAFDKPPTALFVRIMPREWASRISLRFEVYGHLKAAGMDFSLCQTRPAVQSDTLSAMEIGHEEDANKTTRWVFTNQTATGMLTYEIEITHAGVFSLWGLTRCATPQSNTLYVTNVEGMSKEWEVRTSKEWLWQKCPHVLPFDTQTRFNLTIQGGKRGCELQSIYVGDAKTVLDVEQSMNFDADEVANEGATPEIAATEGVLTPPLMLTRGGDAVFTPDGDGYGHVSFVFHSRTLGPLQIAANVKAPVKSVNALFVQIDGADKIPWNMASYSGWSWMTFGQVFTVAQGDHTLTLHIRDDGVELRTVRLVSSVAAFGESSEDKTGLTIGKWDPEPVQMGNSYSWQTAQDRCGKIGKDLCASAVMCPGNPPFPLFPSSTDSWCPVKDRPNDWVQIAEQDPRRCKSHTVLYGSPEWGQVDLTVEVKGTVICCPKSEDTGETAVPLGPPGFELTHTGKRKDGDHKRFVLQTDTVSQNVGSKDAGQIPLGSCAVQCSTSEDCAGIFVRTADERCFLVDKIKTMKSEVEGYSYTKLPCETGAFNAAYFAHAYPRIKAMTEGDVDKLKAYFEAHGQAEKLKGCATCCAEGPDVNYQFTVQTSVISGSDTRSQIFITLYGAAGDTGKKLLGDRFKIGSISSVSIMARDVGAIRKIVLETTDIDSWRCESLVIDKGSVTTRFDVANVEGGLVVYNKDSPPGINAFLTVLPDLSGSSEGGKSPARAEPVTCVVTEWSMFTACDAECDGGLETRYRTITSESGGGPLACPKLAEFRACNTQECPGTCIVSAWSEYSACTKECKGGEQIRSRTVEEKTKPDAVCAELTETRKCNTGPCPRDCVLREWKGWGACDKDCGGGKQKRKRRVKKMPRHGGAKCGHLNEERDCNTHGCIQHCEVTEWESYNKCSVSCGGGSQSRWREVRQIPKYGGEECPELQEDRECNPLPSQFPAEYTNGIHGVHAMRSVVCLASKLDIVSWSKYNYMAVHHVQA
jgi:hypothetical protein